MLKLEAVKLADDKTTALQALDKLDARVRFSRRSPKMVKDGDGGFSPVTDEKHPGKDIAEIIDKTTGERYAQGMGDTDELALKDAIAAATTAPKPLTKAQKSDPAFVAQAEEVKNLRAKIAELEAKSSAPSPVAATEAPAKRTYNRRPKAAPSTEPIL